MDVALLVVMSVLAGVLVLLMIGAHKMEEKHSRWEQFHHPPDSEVKDNEQH